ncbi:hypothetical protein SSX86_006956 [Deinandra increscens subsp. villosa]|uniref:FBD domain-containing protein n=1 Tax=Deinandra increscens subsp. villosa TaxID=3103831 RepID=A0AAP0DJX6_9ASTR
MSSEDEEDRLSRLPDETVSHILSLMPTRRAVQTCVLSKRWRYSWMFVTNLDFDDKHIPSIFERDLYPGFDIHNYPDLNKLIKFVDRVLEFYKPSQVKLFRLQLIHTVTPLCVPKWIDKAVSLNVREFDIRLIELDLPLSLFTCKTLTKLTLNRARGEYYDWECPSGVDLPCLKTLDIHAYTKPFVNVFKLISGCPILETLSLEVEWNKDEEDYIFNIPTLKRMKLALQCSIRNNKIVLNVPNLECLFVGGNSCSHFVFEDVSSLVEACVSYYEIAYDQLWVELLMGVSGVESFSVETVRPLKGCNIPFISPYPLFPNMKHMELKGYWDAGQILQFLESSPHLKHLCIEDADRFFKLGESTWTEPKVVPGCMVKSLTTIKFLKCKKQKWDKKFLKYMLRNAQVLKTVTVVLENFCVEEETRLGAEFRKFPKASPYCEIRFRGRCSPSTDIQFSLVKSGIEKLEL